MYDPLLSEHIEPHQPKPTSYWLDELQSEQIAVTDYPELTNERTVDVAIIGAGYTGLSSAIHLAERGMSVAVLEANAIGWGCAGRNAGFVLPGSGRLGFKGLVGKFGEDTAKVIFSDYFDALDTLDDLIERSGQDVKKVRGGYLKIAHNKKAANAMFNEWQAQPKAIKSQHQYLSSEDIAQFIPDYPGYGAIFRESGEALHPLRLIHALANLAASSDAQLFCQSPVNQWHRTGSQHTLVTSQGTVRAKKVVVATNAYSPKSLSQFMHRQFPVLSSILVTDVIPNSKLSSWHKHLMAMDTRSLKYYYRVLPDNRILFGGRGAVSGKDANTAKSQRTLKQAFDSYFPNLKDIDLAYFWSGWISVAADNIPHIGKYPDDDSVFYASGYCGSGVSFANHAGRRLAQLITGEKEPALQSPIYQTPLPTFPFASFRRLGLHLFYAAHRIIE